LIWVPEPMRGGAPESSPAILMAGLRQLRESVRELRLLRAVPHFLVGYWLYIDGVGTVIQMAVDYGESLGFASEDLITALLITQFVGFPAALLFGKIGEKTGAKTGILIGLGVYIGVCIWAYRMQSASEFYVLAVAVGMVQGGVQSLSRSLYARLIPREKAGEYFGIYNMIGKFAAIIGPILMGVTGLVTKSSRVSILSIIVLFAGGAAFLLRVRTPRECP
jgi:UMF1 family MFS transporter